VDKHTLEGEDPVRLCNYVDVYKNERITSAIPFSNATATDEEVRRFQLQAGDVLITKDSESWDDIAVPAFVEYTAPDLVCGYHLAILRAQEGVLDSNYLFRVQQCQPVSTQYHVSANGITHYGLAHSAIKNILLPVPPLCEQAAIGTFLDRETAKIAALIAKQERMIALLGEKRQALIAHAVTKGLRPDAPMKDSGVAWLVEIPAHWKTTPLKFLVHMVSGGTPDKGNTDYWDGTIPWASAKDMKVEYLGDTEDHITQQAINDRAARIVEPEAAILVVRGMILAHTMPVAINTVPLAINQDMKALIPGANLRSRYLAWQMRGLAETFLSRTDTAGHGTKALREEDWSNIDLAVPPLDVQECIAVHLDQETHRMDQLVEKTTHAIVLLREHRTSLIAAAVTGKIDVRGAAAGAEVDEAGALAGAAR